MNHPESLPAQLSQHTTRRNVTRSEFLQIFTAVMLPMFMAMIDQTLLATATPIVAAEFGNLFDTSWIATAYLLASAVMVPIYGRLGDRHGRREMLLIALAVFVTGSSLSALAPSMNLLIAGRAVQGLGAGGLMSLSFALIGELVPPRQRVSYQGYFAVISMAANVLGPIIGGVVNGLMPGLDLPRMLASGMAAGNAEILRAFHIAFFTIAVVAALGAFSASRVPSLKV